MPIPKIFMIAGEASGDALAAPLMHAFKSREPMTEIEGVGGPLMAEQGLQSLLPMEDLCVMGLTEVAWHLPRLLRLIHGMVEEIEKRQPDFVITVDLPDFNFRVAEKLKKRGIFKGKIYHYVAPTVWAWRPGRAKKIAGFLDGVLCLFPFEPKYFEAVGLKACYVGHPVIETDLSSIDTAAFIAANEIDPKAKTLGVFFGSRDQELKSMSATIIEALELISEQMEDMHIIAPTLPQYGSQVVELLQPLGVPFSVITQPNQKWTAIKSCDYAIAISGTVGLELGYAGVPHVIGYKMSTVSWMIARMMIKTKFAHLINILKDDTIVPEFIQMNFSSAKIAKGLLELHVYPEKAQAQKQAFEKVETILKPEDIAEPSAKAVEFIFQK